MIDVLLFEPEIPPNTGNVMRLCVNTGARLHLIAPLGFTLDDAKLRRAGLDYGDWADVTVHASLDAALRELAPPRVFAFTTRGSRHYGDVRYSNGGRAAVRPRDARLARRRFGLRFPPTTAFGFRCARIHAASISSNAVAVVVYEAWRQFGFSGAR